MEDFELRVLHPVQQHVHAGQVVGGDVRLFRRLPPPPHPAGSLCETKTALPPRCFVLPENLADGAARLLDPMARVEEQRAGATGKVQHALEL